MNKFWWRPVKNQGKGIIWKSWDKLVPHKHLGGLGFRSLHDFNLAMLGKQGWRFITRPDSMVTKVLKARYFPKTDYLSATLGHNPSFIWHSMREAQELLRAGMRRRVGSGNQVSIMKDPWLPTDYNPYISTVSRSLENQNVSSLFKEDSKEWDEDIVRDGFLMIEMLRLFSEFL